MKGLDNYKLPEAEIKEEKKDLETIDELDENDIYNILKNKKEQNKNIRWQKRKFLWSWRLGPLY